ncbi:hypothetical protein EGK14_05650 [Erwinia sp. 198]|nr:hypothetical protein EGK14_05650 [Erwinia sp. 198]
MNVNKKSLMPVLAWGSAFVLLTGIFLSVKLLNNGDDRMFIHILNGKALFPLLQQRYLEWSGRITIEALLIKTINFSLFWRLGIISSITLLSYCAWKTFFDTLKAAYAIPAGIAIFMLITPSVNIDAAWWVTGFYNYLLPVTLASWALLILKNSATASPMAKTAALLTLLVSCFSEQVALVLLIGAISIYCSKQHKERYDALFIVIAFIFSAILLTAPGNTCRYLFEIKNSFPEFSGYSFIDKLTLGIDRLNHHISDPENLLINALFILALANTFQKKNLAGSDFLAVVLVTIKLIGFLLAHFQDGVRDFIYNKNYISAQSWFGFKIYSSYFFTLAAIFSLILLSYRHIHNRNMAIFVLISLLTACATVMMIGFSPTVYASSQRVLFLFEICSLSVLCVYIRVLFIKM